MNRTEFLDTLRSQLSGQMHEGKVAAHVRYYEDYIQSQVRSGRDEQQVDYEEYSTYSDDAQNTQSSSRNHVHVWRFDTWYSKLLGVVILLIVVFLLFHILVAVIPFFAVLALILFIVSLIKNRN